MINPRNKYKCEICGEEFRLSISLRTHKNKEHKGGQNGKKRNCMEQTC